MQEREQPLIGMSEPIVQVGAIGGWWELSCRENRGFHLVVFGEAHFLARLWRLLGRKQVTTSSCIPRDGLSAATGAIKCAWISRN